MNSLNVDGVLYVKASSLARDFGYTSDYIGQLCRNNKVEAQLVGRSWYVSEDSLRQHKESRYRSTKAKTQAAFKARVEKQELAGKERVAPKIGYAAEEAELMPAIKKLSVQDTAESGETMVEIITPEPPKKVAVATVSNAPQHYVPVPRKDPVFKGQLSITHSDEAVSAEEELVSVEGDLEPSARDESSKPKLQGEIKLEPTPETVAEVTISSNLRSKRRYIGYSLLYSGYILALTALVSILLIEGTVRYTQVGEPVFSQNYYASAENFSILIAKIELKI